MLVVKVGSVDSRKRANVSPSIISVGISLSVAPSVLSQLSVADVAPSATEAVTASSLSNVPEPSKSIQPIKVAASPVELVTGRFTL